MPQQSRKTWAELRVGIMAAVALGLLGYLVFLLSGSHGLFRTRATIYTYMGDSSDLAQGAPVRLNGIIIGKVSKVGLSGESDPRKVIKVDMEIDEEYMGAIPTDSIAKIASGNLLGTKYINITRGTKTETVKAGAVLPGSATGAIEDLFEQGNVTLGALQETVKKVNAIVDSIQNGQGTIGKLLVDETLYNRFLGIGTEAQKLIVTLNSNKGTIPKLLNDDKLYEDVRGTVARINSMMDGIEQGQGTAGKLLKDPALYDDTRATINDTRKTIAQLNQLLTDINAGKGTVGKLLKTDELNDQIKGTIARLDGLLDKINNGQGTIGMLMNNPSVYESLDSLMRESNGLMKDFRANPKKFLHIKLSLF